MKEELSGKNLRGANLSQSDLSGSHLFDACMENADLVGADLSGCDLTHANLKNADLTRANLSQARLWNTDLSGANLSEANLSGADFWNARLFNVKLWHTIFSDTKFLNVRSFSDGKLINKARINEAGFLSAEESYRDLKKYFLANGMYNDASWASFKEKTMERMILKKNLSLNYFPSFLMNALCGYGEKPFRIIFSAAFTIAAFAILYSFLGAVQNAASPAYILKSSDYIYYSTVTFTTVGYGDFIPKDSSLFRLIAAGEAFIGTFLTGLFIFTLARKYSAR